MQDRGGPGGLLFAPTVRKILHGFNPEQAPVRDWVHGAMPCREKQAIEALAKRLGISPYIGCPYVRVMIGPSAFAAPVKADSIR